MLKVFPGTVFVAEHFDQFTRSFKTHRFVCVYVQGLDNDIERSSDVIGIMITSKESGSGQIEIPVEKNPKIVRCPSYVNINNTYTFSVPPEPKDSFYVLGSIDAETFREIIKRRSDVAHTENSQCLHSLYHMVRYEVLSKGRE